MEHSPCAVLENRPIAQDVWRLTLRGPTDAITAPGQFAHVAVPGFFLRRPLSVADWDADAFTLIYKAVGPGTRALTQTQRGAALDVLLGLGNGFDPSISETPLLVGGGVGVPPLFGLAKAFLRRGIAPTVCLGFNGPGDVLLAEDFKALGCPTHVALACEGQLVTNLLPPVFPDRDACFACGPEPMLRTVHALCPDTLQGQFSFETRMACGIGACMGCTCETRFGGKRLCKEGPVLRKEEILWQT
jgi:dihydroorotate dehydrogenase electron transfer subunit